MGIRSVVITGNCTVGGIVEGLATVLPTLEIRGYPVWELETPEQIALAAEHIAAADAWLRMPLPDNERLDPVARAREIIDLPNLVFSAFHQDAVYAVRASGDIFRGITDYHSAIGLWAWRNGLAPDVTARLFSPDVMRQLTYDRYWEPSVKAMRDDFAASSLSFPAFWARLKRTGVFMHTINHPTAHTLSLFVKAIAVRLGATDSVWDIPAERYMQDFLTHIVWPIYPWVGTSLGVRGDFRWKMDDRVFETVESWLAATWVAYGDHERGDVFSPRIDDGVYDQVLGAALADLGVKVAR